MKNKDINFVGLVAGAILRRKTQDILQSHERNGPILKFDGLTVFDSFYFLQAHSEDPLDMAGGQDKQEFMRPNQDSLKSRQSQRQEDSEGRSSPKTRLDGKMSAQFLHLFPHDRESETPP